MPYGIYNGSSVIAQFVTPMTVRSNQPIAVSDTLSLKRLGSQGTAQRWEIETSLEPLSSGAQDLFLEVVTKGYTSAVQVITPQNYGVTLKRTSTSTPTATGSLNSTLITITQNSNTGLIAKGSFIKFANHNKVYLLTSDILNSTAGLTASIYPALRSAVSTTAFTHRDDVVMTCYWDTDTVRGMTFTDGLLQDLGKIKLVEAV
jgi:hypothetical protein